MIKRLSPLLVVAVATATPAYAERVYLISVGRSGGDRWTTTVPMKSIEQCEAAGLKLQAAGKNGKLTNMSDFVGYECIFGE